MTVVISGLTRLLPRLQSQDEGALSEQHRKILGTALSSDSSELVQAILQCFEQIGGPQELLLVERLAEGKGKAVDRQTQAKAQECLAHLRDRTQLLRVAQGSSPADPGLLLRPSEEAQRPPTSERGGHGGSACGG
jgi:hypothetical protein